MTYAIGSDHAGFALKEALKEYLTKKGYELVDYGTHSSASCNYPEIAEKVANAIVEGKHPRGILICGTGIGISIAANKVNGIRAAAVSDYFGAKYLSLIHILRSADMILVIQDGRIAESGTHESLMAENGIYAGMNRIQSAEDAVQ